MLTSETKRKIDSARDILVGVIPVPHIQVEQITYALIYKFMDDMDKEAIELGGQKQFFSGDYERYSWSNLMSTRLTGDDRKSLYSQALAEIPKNPQIPELFRTIFKRAYLPFNDSQKLNLFLTQIDKFQYDHSEELGNAFEYLLSIMGAQGDGGQFRTPRHIIDFVCEVVQPFKTDTILDPACGTAGFLISAYKYIQQNNTLTHQERITLGKNLMGYDISAPMVELGLVNLYLHGFATPIIKEYDTLSDDTLWGTKYDVILANPPFMTPKGGIKPHKKFQVQANRAEVLFVDYIIEHLTSKGKAGIIVPEGIIFQSGNAYKKLRQLLIDEGLLWAVVSLPSGVFQPYSGVKTSILLLDKQIAAKKDNILFVKISHDGFDLGAQRRVIDKNELPQAIETLRAYKSDKEIESEIAHTVSKAKIGESGDYNLSGDRYKVSVDQSNARWPMVELKEIFIEIKNGKNVKQFNDNGKYKVSRIQTIADGTVNLEKTKNTNDKVNENDFLREGDILFSHINSFEHLAKTALFGKCEEKVVHGANLIRLRPDFSKILPKYALYIFKSKNFIENARNYAQKAVNQASINTVSINSFKIPLPPLEVQEKIVAEIDGYQKIIDGAKMIVDNWKPHIDKNIKLVHPREKILNALKKLKKHDSSLIEHNVNERSISSKLAFYLMEQFALYDVDHEYNRENRYNSKRNSDGERIFPDIIIHKRNTDNNFIAIEVKKADSQDIESDRKKLIRLSEEKGYRNVYQIIIDNKNSSVEEWIFPVIEVSVPENTGEWPMVELSEICELIRGVTYSKADETQDQGLEILRANNINLDGTLNLNEIKKLSIQYKLNEEKKLKKGDIFICLASGSTTHIGKVAFINYDTNYYFGGFMGVIRMTQSNKTLPEYVFYLLKNSKFNEYLNREISGVNINNLNSRILGMFKIPLPPLEVQEQIVAEIEAEQQLVESAKKLIDIYQTKITNTVNKLWETEKKPKIAIHIPEAYVYEKSINKIVEYLQSNKKLDIEIVEPTQRLETFSDGEIINLGLVILQELALSMFASYLYDAIKNIQTKHTNIHKIKFVYQKTSDLVKLEFEGTLEDLEKLINNSK